MTVIARRNDEAILSYAGSLLSGNDKGCRKCHIRPNLLLIYRINEGILELACIEVGSHSDLFG